GDDTIVKNCFIQGGDSSFATTLPHPSAGNGITNFGFNLLVTKCAIVAGNGHDNDPSALTVPGTGGHGIDNQTAPGFNPSNLCVFESKIISGNGGNANISLVFLPGIAGANSGNGINNVPSNSL